MIDGCNDFARVTADVHGIRLIERAFESEAADIRPGTFGDPRRQPSKPNAHASRKQHRGTEHECDRRPQAIGLRDTQRVNQRFETRDLEHHARFGQHLEEGKNGRDAEHLRKGREHHKPHQQASLHTTTRGQITPDIGQQTKIRTLVDVLHARSRYTGSRLDRAVVAGKRTPTCRYGRHRSVLPPKHARRPAPRHRL